MENMAIRIAMTKCGMKQWQLAKLLNISESALSRLLRAELPEEKQKDIVAMIQNGKAV